MADSDSDLRAHLLGRSVAKGGGEKVREREGRGEEGGGGGRQESRKAGKKAGKQESRKAGRQEVFFFYTAFMCSHLFPSFPSRCVFVDWRFLV